MVTAQKLTDHYALYNGDCCEVMPTLPSESVGLSIHSPPFCGLYNYSSSDRDLSNCRSYDEFFKHYEFVASEIYRLTMTGRLAAVHCMDIPRKGANLAGGLIDFPGDIIRLYEKCGFSYTARHAVWKEPLGVRNRTMAKGLAHMQVCEDSSLCDVASADYLLLFRKNGENNHPVTHPVGLLEYAGARSIPQDVLEWRGFDGDQKKNRFSHWIWRQYASAFWDDVRIDNVLPYEESKDPDDERHVHPLQLDVIHRIVVLRSNQKDVVLTPFMGVGSEVYEAVKLGRKGIGIELKPSYYRQACKNVAEALENAQMENQELALV